VEGTGLENRRRESVLEFESLLFRQIQINPRMSRVCCFQRLAKCHCFVKPAESKRKTAPIGAVFCL
ncbi:hypothetical protein, partial [Plesiomonas sp. ZOR0011]|uniref:hypothetical protein n=1 Tax=Plesiomonas sp. ZOR0011 TaxID=1339230 RepID=UPI001C486F5C